MDKLPELNREHIILLHGQSWVADAHIREVGYENPGVGDIIRSRINNVGDIYLEINGPAIQKGITPSDAGWIKGWWVQRIVPEEEFADLLVTGGKAEE